MEKKRSKWLILIVLFTGGGIIYQLPLLRILFYQQMIDGMGFTNTQIGVLGSAFGIASIISYFPGGILADKFSCKKLISLSFLMISIGGFYYATIPSYKISVILNFYFGVFSTLTYWAALIKATSMIGKNEESGKMFGILEGGRGVVSTIGGIVAMQVFNYIGVAKLGISTVIVFYSVVYLICAIISFVFLEDSNKGNVEVGKTGITLRDLMKVTKDKNVWLIAVMILSFYSIYVSQAYITPYLVDIFGISASAALFLGIVRSYVTQFTGGPVGGLISTKMGSSTRFVRVGFIICIICLGVFLILPGKKAFAIVAIVNMIVLMLVNYAVRGVYFSTINEVNIKPEVRGSATGLASFIGFTPDVFAPVLIGFFLDNYHNAGYKYMFIYIIISLLIGLVATSMLMKNIKKSKATEELENI